MSDKHIIAAMETLLSLHRLPLHLTNPSLNSRSQTGQHKTLNNSIFINLPKRTWKLYAQAKGFGTTMPEEKKANTETITGTNSGRKNGDGGNDDEIPQVVFERMIVRILFYVGVPLSMGVAFLLLFDIMKDQYALEVPIWLPFLTTFLTFGASALGIAYGTLSTSWDPEKEGSFLGVEEVQRNWVELWREEDGF